MNDLELNILLDEVAEKLARTSDSQKWIDYLKQKVKLAKKAINTPDGVRIVAYAPQQKKYKAPWPNSNDIE